VARLIYTDGGTEHEFALDPGRAAYTVGRNPMCDLSINNPSISRKHAEIRLDAVTGKYSVYDLNSSNGTYVNGKRGQQGELSEGDEVMCGEFKLFFHTNEGSGRRSSPPGGPRPAARLKRRKRRSSSRRRFNGSKAISLPPRASPNAGRTSQVHASRTWKYRSRSGTTRSRTLKRSRTVAIRSTR
jgi:pSer/pThr/pTyr-binding forkhead associated (FHA) protein